MTGLAIAHDIVLHAAWLRRIEQSSIFLFVSHGTHGVSYRFLHKARRNGCVKINVNRWDRDEYTKFRAENAGTPELTVLKEKDTEVYAG
jgi:fructose-bisphosphate aldolase class II